MSEILGLFPEFKSLGGVQTSGRLAWEAVQRCSIPSTLFLYDEHRVLRDEDRCSHRVLVGRSKLHSIVQGLRWRGRPRMVLVWHLRLLKLLPSFRTRSSKLFLFLHGIESWEKPSFMTARLLSQVDRFLVNSEFTWSRFLHFHPNMAYKAHTVVHLGVGAPIACAREDRAEPSAVMISRLSRGEDYKGHREMISVWRDVVQRHPRAVLSIVGDGDLRPDLEVLVDEYELGQHVRFYGNVSDQKKEAILECSSFLALPSLGEGFGLVYAEAMRFGKPCLVSDRDGGREVVNPPEAGLAVDPSNRCQLVDAICRLISDTGERHIWLKNAKRRYDEYFTAAHFQKRLLHAMGLYT